MEWLRVVIPTAAVVFFLLGPLLYLQIPFPWEVGYREQAHRVLVAEIARLPSLNDVPEVSRSEVWQVRAEPFISVDYPQTGPCATVHAYYRALARQQGWLPGGGTLIDPHLDESYHKVVGNFYMNLTVECGAGTETSAPLTAPADYNLTVRVPYPYAVRIIGPWFPK